MKSSAIVTSHSLLVVDDDLIVSTASFNRVSADLSPSFNFDGSPSIPETRQDLRGHAKMTSHDLRDEMIQGVVCCLCESSTSDRNRTTE